MATGFLISLSMYNFSTWREAPLQDRKRFLNFVLNTMICFEAAMMDICGLVGNKTYLIIVVVYMFVLTIYQRHKMFEILFEDMEHDDENNHDQKQKKEK